MAHKVAGRARRKILGKLHEQLAGRRRCLTFDQMAAFVNEHVPGWTAEVKEANYTPEQKLFASVSWFGRTQTGKKLTITDAKGVAILEGNTTDPYHRNSYTLMQILSEMGCGTGRTPSTDDELNRYDWYNPFGLPTSRTRRRRR